MMLQEYLWRIRKLFRLKKKLPPADKRNLTGAFRDMVRAVLPAGNWTYSKSQFVNNRDGVEQILFVHTSDLELELWISLAMGVRFGKVEEIWCQSTGRSGDRDEWTVEGVISNLVPKPQLRYRIDRIADVRFCRPKISNLISRACVPFWNQFASPVDVDRIWNVRPFDFASDATNALHHATRSLIIAKLVKNSGFDKLVEKRRAEVSQLVAEELRVESLREFDQAVAWLRTPRNA